MSPVQRVLILSIGNPGKYRDTYHSAGHIVLESLRKQLSLDLPPFTTTKYGKQPALASIGWRYSLVQSPAIMNVSGVWVAAAIRQHFEEYMLSPEQGAVVLIHDDLELEMGAVKTRKWDSSHKGHNGVRSIQSLRILLSQAPGAKFARVSVGIGRPQGRDKATVSDFVLSTVSRHDRSVLEGRSTEGVLDALISLESKWKDG
ncbi:peptidyl-tRNA hydrolase [Madurella fahalii]|uniref:peptidyl-tRNA hydrolase n=1 Tax=Madurella fahalii TaxID=1157608 RepID=A0ABQ0GAD5_9PEZI